MDKKRLVPKMSKHRIVLFDNHTVMREGFAQLINHQPDLQVCGQVGNAGAAMELIGELKPDLAILSMSLENTHGIEFIKQIKLRHPNQRILILSMQEESLYGERALRAGANGYVIKQQPTEQVMKAIRNVLRGELYLNERMLSTILAKFISGEPPTGGSEIEQLSHREREVFQLIGHGRKTREIAAELHLSVNTIDTYRAHIKKKLKLNDGMELVRSALHWATKQSKEANAEQFLLP